MSSSNQPSMTISSSSSSSGSGSGSRSDIHTGVHIGSQEGSSTGSTRLNDSGRSSSTTKNNNQYNSYRYYDTKDDESSVDTTDTTTKSIQKIEHYITSLFMYIIISTYDSSFAKVNITQEQLNNQYHLQQSHDRQYLEYMMGPNFETTDKEKKTFTRIFYYNYYAAVGSGIGTYTLIAYLLSTKGIDTSAKSAATAASQSFIPNYMKYASQAATATKDEILRKNKILGGRDYFNNSKITSLIPIMLFRRNPSKAGTAIYTVGKSVIATTFRFIQSEFLSRVHAGKFIYQKIKSKLLNIEDTTVVRKVSLKPNNPNEIFFVQRRIPNTVLSSQSSTTSLLTQSPTTQSTIGLPTGSILEATTTTGTGTSTVGAEITGSSATATESGTLATSILPTTGISATAATTTELSTVVSAVDTVPVVPLVPLVPPLVLSEENRFMTKQQKIEIQKLEKLARKKKLKQMQAFSIINDQLKPRNFIGEVAVTTTNTTLPATTAATSNALNTTSAYNNKQMMNSPFMNDDLNQSVFQLTVNRYRHLYNTYLTKENIKLGFKEALNDIKWIFLVTTSILVSLVCAQVFRYTELFFYDISQIPINAIELNKSIAQIKHRQQQLEQYGSIINTNDTATDTDNKPKAGEGKWWSSHPLLKMIVPFFFPDSIKSEEEFELPKCIKSELTERSCPKIITLYNSLVTTGTCGVELDNDIIQFNTDNPQPYKRMDVNDDAIKNQFNPYDIQQLIIKYMPSIDGKAKATTSTSTTTDNGTNQQQQQQNYGQPPETFQLQYMLRLVHNCHLYQESLTKVVEEESSSSESMSASASSHKGREKYDKLIQQL